MLKRTPFHDFHVSAGARMVEFAGWEMPILYRSIVEEHHQTRRSGSIFDVSHMGRLCFRGLDALRFLDHVVTRGLADQQVGQSRYSLVCNEAGGILDDVIVSRAAEHWTMVCNASNREKLVTWFSAVRAATGFDLEITDNTESTGMLAIQGPKVIDYLAPVMPFDLRELKRYHFLTESYMLVPFTVFRSGYTGEDGVEVVVPARVASMAINLLGGRLAGPDAVIQPAGLGARDTLRLEAGMPLYGHELSEQIDPISAGLGWAVDLNKEFIGVQPLREIARCGSRRRLVGLELEGKRIARQGLAVLSRGVPVGQVTSGTFAPTLQKSIAMAYVEAEHTADGTALQVDLKGTLNPARIVKLPFYRKGR